MPARPLDHLGVGRLGEAAAADLLAEKGLRILARNLHLERLELDLVCQDGQTLVFVEVKTRAEGSLATPAEGLTRQKAERLLRAGRLYLSEHGLWDRPCRFDLVSVLVRQGRVVGIEHTENVIADGGGGGGWQPW
jgi:putative endonuclease